MLKCQAGGRDRAEPHQFRLHARVGVSHQSCQGLEAIGLDRRGSGQQHGGGAIIQSRGVAGGDGAVFLEGGTHLCQLFKRGAAGMFVDTEQLGALAAAHFHRDDLPIEAPFVERALCPQLFFQGQLVLHLAGDAIAFGDVLGGDAHVDTVERVMENAEHIIDGLHIAHARTPAGGG